MSTVIKVENLGKKYIISHQKKEQYTALRDVMAESAKNWSKRIINPFAKKQEDHSREEFWALKDVSFEIKQGDRVGIIGRNGAGKSTLLKLLSRITEPTTGRIRLKGRVASLLEVGTGFHPELTGRENIFLNGAILGMSRAEIKKKFDEIVDFAEVEKFLDTPVKRYSSGMYVRLAFAVAAHLEPEILIVDEVLAVGDAQFQKKCLGKMEDVGKEGRTVLFVSHNMNAITRLCERVILLDKGVVKQDGGASNVVSAYKISDFGTTALREWSDVATAPGDEIARLMAVRVKLKDGTLVQTLDIRQSVGIETEYEVLKDGQILVPNYNFQNEEGIILFFALDQDLAWKQKPRPLGRYKSVAWIPGNFFAEGTVTVNVAITTLTPFTVHYHEQDAVAFQIVDSLDGDSARREFAGNLPGVVRPLLNWTTSFSLATKEKQIG